MFRVDDHRTREKPIPHCLARKRPGSHCASAFTLLELLLVLTLIVILYSLAAPALKRPLATQGLWKAADTVRVEWSATRVRAMRTGRIHVFQFQPSTNQYRIQPWVTDEDMVESNDATMYGVTGYNQMGSSRSPRDEQRQLTDGVLLVSAQVDDDRSAMMTEAGEVLNQLDPSWSSPVFFYPDGTTSTARLLLSNRYQDWVAVRLRGLTGVARTEAVDKNEEALP